MTASTDHSPAWYQALTLIERLSSLRATGITVEGRKFNKERAADRLERWRASPVFGRESLFEARLALDQLSEDELLYLLGEPAETVKARFGDSPAWLARLADAFSAAGADNVPAKQLPAGDAGIFLAVIHPLISRSCAALRRGLEELLREYPHAPVHIYRIENTLYSNLFSQLLSVLNRTVVLELNVARLQGLLDGDTPEERFASFGERIRQPEHALALLREYPVLARLLVTHADNWLNFALEFCRHLCADWEQIKASLCDDEPGVLTEIKAGAGDSHRQGRTVVIMTFASGFQLVYKPRSMAVDLHLQDLLSWLNERGDHPPFRLTKILDYGTHGWSEFIAAEDCPTLAAVGRFYERQGGYLALLYALEAVDFHYENLIAAGEHPVLIDLESLFHPRSDEAPATHSEQLAAKTLNRSVLRIGLLPQRVWFTADYEGIDVSGLGAAEGQRSPFAVPYWEGGGTDEMHIAHKRIAMTGGQHRPMYAGAQVDLTHYQDALVAGFTSVYKTLMRHRDELLSPAGPLEHFAQDEVRVILRPTKTYFKLLHESYHPNLLRDALDRDRFLDRLWAEVEHLPALAKVISAEQADMRCGDIPVFTTRPCSRHLWTSTGQMVFDFFGDTGMSHVRHRIAHLSSDDLTAQAWIISASFTSLSMGTQQARSPSYQLPATPPRADSQQLLTAARAVGDRLETLALRGEEGDAAWLGLSLFNQRNWTLLPAGLDLYSGLPGIALFLAYLGSVSGERRYLDLAEAARTTMRRQVELHRDVLKSVGGFAGWGGVIYALTHMAALLNSREIYDEARALVELLPELIESDESLDVIGGSAGCIGSLLSLHHTIPTERAVEMAVRCGERLIARAQPMDEGIGWLTPIQRTRPLTGFSHGAAGMAWALSRLFAVTGEKRFREAALAAVAYERSLFSTTANNWPDLRDLDAAETKQPDSYFTAWCHGAAGIGLARLEMLGQLDDSLLREEIDAALENTRAQGFGLSHCLCHGDLGNVELLLRADEVFGADRASDQLVYYSSAILESIEREGWLTGIPSAVESPGLMTGLAGIGYGLLRLSAPQRVPPVLTLAPPRPSAIL